MALGLDGGIGELAIKVVPDTSTFGKDVNAGVGTSVSKASGVALGAVAAVGGGLLALGTQLDDAYDSIRTNTGATGEQLAALEGQFDRVAASSSSSLDEVASIVTTLNQRLEGSAKSGQIEALASQFLDLEQITGESSAGAAEAFSGLVNQFQIEGGELEGVLDNFFKVSQRSGVSVEALATSYNKGGAALEALGFNMGEGIQILGEFERSGIDANKGVAGLTRVLREAAKEGIPADEALAGLTDSIRNAATDAEAAGIAMDVFGAKGGAQLAGAIRSGAVAFDELNPLLGASGDTIAGVATETADAAETFKELKNTLAIALGPAASKLFSTFGESAKEAAPAIILVVDALLPLITAVASLPAPVLAAIIGVLAAGVAFGKVVGPIQSVIGVVKALSAVLAANPYILIIAATIALVIIIVKNWDTIKEWIGVALDFITEKITTFVEWVKPYWDAVWAAVSAVVEVAFSVIKTIFETYVAIWVGIFTGLFDVVKGIFQTGWDAIVGIINVAKGIIDGAISGVKSVIEGVGTALETVKNIATGAWDWIVGRFIWARDEIKKLAGQIKDAALDALGPLGDVIGGVGGVVGKGLNLLGFDEGGVVPGPKGKAQMILAHGGETILPTHKTGFGVLDPMSGGGGAGTTVQGPMVALYGPVSIRSDQDIVDLSRELARETRVTSRAAGKQTVGI